jgi:hypothetical protein
VEDYSFDSYLLCEGTVRGGGVRRGGATGSGSEGLAHVPEKFRCEGLQQGTHYLILSTHVFDHPIHVLGLGVFLDFYI